MTSARKSTRWLVTMAVVAVSMSLGRVGAQDSPAPDVARGHHIATALAGCADCHGATFAGGRSFTRGDVTVEASNLTPGLGGIAAYSNAELRRAIRTGVRPDGSTLQVMPWREYAVLTDDDVTAVVAFLRSLPPVDHRVARSAAPPAPAAGGAYLAAIGSCTTCHGVNLGGGNRIDDVIAPNISHTGIGNWSFADFATAMRSGKTPTGRMLSKKMPWERVGKMTDEELRSLYGFLESKP